MPGDRVLPLGEAIGSGQIAVRQQVGRLEEVGLLGKLVDGVAAVAEHPRLTVEQGDGAARLGGVPVTGVEGHQPGLGSQPGDVDGALTVGSFHQRKGELLAVDAETSRAVFLVGGHRSPS